MEGGDENVYSRINCIVDVNTSINQQVIVTGLRWPP
jgi:hypothetical protein